MRKPLTYALAVTAALTLAACASVPQAAPQLSFELAGRVEESRRAHVDAVRLYMDSRRKDVDEFLQQEWIPLFARDALKQPTIAAAWEHAVRSNDPAARLEVLVGLGTRLQREINGKREELMEPLDQAELLITRQLEDHYNEMLAMNSSLTALLGAAAKATETQQQIVRKIDPEHKLTDFLDTADRIANALVERADDLAKQRARVDSLLQTLRRR